LHSLFVLNVKYNYFEKKKHTSKFKLETMYFFSNIYLILGANKKYRT
jgi:hypothetical protein